MFTLHYFRAFPYENLLEVFIIVHVLTWVLSYEVHETEVVEVFFVERGPRAIALFKIKHSGKHVGFEELDFVLAGVKNSKGNVLGFLREDFQENFVNLELLVVVLYYKQKEFLLGIQYEFLEVLGNHFDNICLRIIKTL